MARLIYGEWFVKFRFPGHKKVKMVGSALGPIPEGWELVHVEDAVRRVPSGQKYEQKTVAPSGMVPVLDQGKSGIIGYHNDEPGVLASEENPVIVFANHTCYQRIVHFPFSAIQNVLPFLPSIERQRNIYWLHWATKDLVRFNDYKGHWPEFMSKTLVLPPATVCSEFGALAKPLSLQIFVLEKIVSNLRFTRDLLLPKLISGEIDVESLDIKMPAENGAATAATV
jgi:type I restriction enzyme S subunit